MALNRSAQPDKNTLWSGMSGGVSAMAKSLKKFAGTSQYTAVGDRLDRGYQDDELALPISGQSSQPDSARDFKKKVPENHWKDEWDKDTEHGCAFTWCVVFCQWSVPFLFNVIANLSMSFMLHIGTYYYIQVMHRFERAYANVANVTHEHLSLSAGLKAGDRSYGSLEDPIEGHFGWQRISLQELDAAALVLPACWLLLIVLKRDVQSWSKTLVCHGMLALIKGILSCLTTIPDSIGWESCKERLGPANLANITNIPDPSLEPGNAFIALLNIEFAGYIEAKPVRFCADMLYSGHTFVTCLYGFALIELARKSFIGLPKNQRIAILLVVSAFFALEQLYEIRAVVLNRFHYTVDIFLAIIMVLLWYTNGPLALAVSKWARMGRSPRQPVPAKKFIPSWHLGDSDDQKDRSELEQKILRGPDMQQRHKFEYIAASKATKETVENAAKHGLIVVDVPKFGSFNAVDNPDFAREELPVGLQMWAHRWGLGLVPRDAFNNRDGDLWVPPACIPFSCGLMGERTSIVKNSYFEKYDPHQMHKSDPTAWCWSGFPDAEKAETT